MDTDSNSFWDQIKGQLEAVGVKTVTEVGTKLGNQISAKIGGSGGTTGDDGTIKQDLSVIQRNPWDLGGIGQAIGNTQVMGIGLPLILAGLAATYFIVKKR